MNKHGDAIILFVVSEESSMSNLAFYAADTLGMELWQLGGKLESSEIRPIRLGAWQADLSVDAKSDIITGTALSSG